MSEDLPLIQQFPLQDIDNPDDSVLEIKSVCAECKHCLTIQRESFYCTAGKVNRSSQHPITGLEARIFITNANEREPFVFDIDDLPFPSCYCFNETGNCQMYEFGAPRNIEIADEPDCYISVELDAYKRALGK